MIFPWSKKLRQTQRQLVETQERLEATTRRLVELDGLCQRQQNEAIRMHNEIAELQRPKPKRSKRR